MCPSYAYDVQQKYSRATPRSFHRLFFSILKADQSLILSIGKLTFESDMWYWITNWFFHLRPYLKIIVTISLASSGNPQRYGSSCDVTGNHEIWDVTPSLRTYSHEGCRTVHREVRPAGSLEYCQGITQYVNKQKKVRVAKGLVSLAYKREEVNEGTKSWPGF